MKGSTKPKEVWHIHQSKNERSSIKEDSEMSSDDKTILKSFAKGTPYHKKKSRIWKEIMHAPGTHVKTRS